MHLYESTGMFVHAQEISTVTSKGFLKTGTYLAQVVENWDILVFFRDQFPAGAVWGSLRHLVTLLYKQWLATASLFQEII